MSRRRQARTRIRAPERKETVVDLKLGPLSPAELAKRVADCKAAAVSHARAANDLFDVPLRDRLNFLIPADEKTMKDSPDKFRVQLMKDHHLQYPDLWLNIHVVGNEWEQRAFAEMFARAACWKAETIEEADVVVFTGGPDVDPQLYGEEAHKLTHISAQRDSADIAVYQQCYDLGIPMFGVCRGAQFLHVMNGGKLYQHVDNHNSEHSIWDVHNQKTIDRVSSVHHQMCIDNEAGGMELVATSNKSNNRWRNPKENDIGKRAEVEAFFYSETCCFGVQGHPEYRGYNAFSKWCLDRMQDFFVNNLDIDWVGGRRRLRKDVMAMRKKPTSKSLKSKGIQ